MLSTLLVLPRPIACRDMILAKELMRTCYEGYQAMAAKLAPEIWRFKISVGHTHSPVPLSNLICATQFRIYVVVAAILCHLKSLD